MKALVFTAAACIVLAGCGQRETSSTPIAVIPPLSHAQRVADYQADFKRALRDEMAEGETQKVTGEYAAAFAKAQRYGLCIDTSIARNGCYPNSAKRLPPGNWTPKGYVDSHGAVIVLPSQRNNPI